MIILDDTQKIIEIKKIFKMFHNGEDEYGYEIDWDTIDVCMKIEQILKR